MFKQRVMTALVLIPLVFILLYYANYWVFVAIVLFLTAGMIIEWLPLIPIPQLLPKLAFAGLVLLLIGFSFVQGVFMGGVIIATVVWVSILVCLLRFPASQAIWGKPLIVGLWCAVLLPMFVQSMASIVSMREGKALIVYLLCLVWAADTGAYLAGKYWGRHKLIPLVSPGKTVEGFFGGLVLTLIIASLGLYYFKITAWVAWLLIAIAVGLLSVLGDLFVSMLKRRAVIKDTGSIFPGHGGLLDRLDSLLPSALFFYCSLILIHW